MFNSIVNGVANFISLPFRLWNGPSNTDYIEPDALKFAAKSPANSNSDSTTIDNQNDKCQGNDNDTNDNNDECQLTNMTKQNSPNKSINNSSGIIRGHKRILPKSFSWISEKDAGCESAWDLSTEEIDNDNEIDIALFNPQSNVIRLEVGLLNSRRKRARRGRKKTSNTKIKKQHKREHNKPAKVIRKRKSNQEMLLEDAEYYISLLSNNKR